MPISRHWQTTTKTFDRRRRRSGGTFIKGQIELTAKRLTTAEDDLRELARSRNVADVAMSPNARAVFDDLRTRIREIDNSIIEVAEKYSVAYHGPSFFLEVLPRKHRLSLLLALEFNEVNDPLGISMDASQKKFFVNAAHGGGAYLTLDDSAEIDDAMPLIRQAHAVASKQ